MSGLVTKFEVPKSVPEQIRESLELLTGAWFALNRTWQLYRELFIDAPENLKLMRETAPDFFRQIQLLLYKDILLGISRFTDSKSLQKENQSLCLAELFIETRPPLLKELEQLAEKSKNIRKVRNKVIAHLDRRYMANPNLLPTGKILADIKQSVELIEEIIKKAWKKWANVDFSISRGRSEAIPILRNLKKAQAYTALEQNGKVPKNFWMENYLDRVAQAQEKS